MSQAGGCRCGAVTYELDVDHPPHIYACHCLHCQTWSGGAFGEHAMTSEASLHCTGPTGAYSHTTGGVVFDDVACEVCHTRIYNRNSATPGVVFLRAGTLSDSHRLEPIAHIWTKRKQPWIAIPDDIPTFEESPTPEAFEQAVQQAQARRHRS
jgi:hypothetical protein